MTKMNIIEKYPAVPVFLLKMALYANLPPGRATVSGTEIPSAARLVSLFAGLGEELVPVQRKNSGLEELESALLRTMYENLEAKLPESVDVQLTEELASIAEENEW